MSFKHLGGSVILAIAVVLSVSCSDGDKFTQQATTQNFTQSFNPEYVDILFMVNDRSPMHRNVEQIFAQADAFFERLDAIPSQYRLAIVTHDMEISNGRLQPRDNPYILEKKIGVGSTAQRANIFKNLLNLSINLHTGATDQGFLSAYTALNLYFKPRANVPLVLVFISDSDDHSPVPPGETDAVEGYKKLFLGLKGNKADLLRAYSINYKPLGNGELKSEQNRCATFGDADIDQTTGFQDRYFKLARALGGVQGDRATAGLCGPYASLIDLSGLRQLELPRRFTLEKRPQAGSLIVSVFLRGGEQIQIPFTYESATNEIVFESAPPEGTTITVTFHAGV